MSETDFEFAIVGSGVAGALVARQLAQAGRKVVILESGGRIDRTEALDRYQHALIRNLSAPYPNWPWAPIPDESNPAAYFGKQSSPRYSPSYLKLVGGTTWHWTGNTPRFLPHDFELEQRYGVGVDWPISYSELEPFYLKAEYALGVAGDSQDDQGSPRSGPYPMPPIPMTYADKVLAGRLAPLGVKVKPFPAARNSQPYDDRMPCCGSNNCTPICPSGAQYSAHTDVEKAVHAGARLIDRATVYRLETNESQRLVALHYKLPDGTTHRLTALHFVLAANSIESPRLLLMSANPLTPEGIANSSGQVGRNLMDHILFFHSFSMPVPLYSGRGPQCVSALALGGRDGQFRRRHAATKLFISNALDAHAAALHRINDEANWGKLIPQLRNELIHRSCFGGEIETLPDEQNRVILDSGRTDPLGLTLPKIEYRLSDYSERGLIHWQERVAELIKKIGGTSLATSTQYSSHHPSGTLRMGRNAMTSVVDEHCQSHDHANLYISGSSVFPSLGTANPTLTVAALSLRLAEKLLKLENEI
jgi:choline dehydrogenase-like flavoprotein